MILDLQTLEPPDSPNWFLACPPGWEQPACKLRSPVYGLPVEALEAAFLAVAEKQARTTLMQLDESSLQAEFQQKSALFGFVDVVVVEFVAMGPQDSSLAVYSRSSSGYYDFGVNRARVENWLAALSESVSR